MLVKNNDVEYVKNRLAGASFVAVDTETFGLRQFHGDTPFSVIFAVPGETFYVPVRRSNGIHQKDLIDISGWSALFSRQLVFMQNAKFDLHHLATIGFGLPPQINVHDTMVAARLIDSNLPKYNLDTLAFYFLKEKKDDKVMEYVLSTPECQSFTTKYGTDEEIKLLHFDKVPLDLIVPYAEKDARLTLEIGLEQLSQIDAVDRATRESSSSKPLLRSVLENEYRVTRALEDMERKGVLLDREGTIEAIREAREENEKAKEEYNQRTAENYKASSKAFYRHLESAGADLSDVGTTEHGNVSIDRKTLGKLTDPLADVILRVKDSKTRLNFYYGFVHASDPYNFIHTDFKQAGTRTSRFSSANPNLQNLKREDEEDPDPHSPRRLLIPPSPDHCFFLPDYNQMEYRLLLDYAGEMDLIERVLAGMDVHQATAEKVAIDRSRAKTLNFAIIFGAGPERVAEMLGISVTEARNLISDFFSALPKIKHLIDQAKFAARARKYTYNWLGRRNHYHGQDPKHHAAVNHLIQSGCADIMKVGLVRCWEMLRGTKSWLTLSIHDELVFSLHKSDIWLAPELAKIMENAYPYRHVPLTVSVSHSWKSLGEKVKGYPICKE